MDLTLLFALGSLILVILLCVVVFFKLPKETENKPQPRPVPNRIRDNAPRRAQMARNRGARLRANVAQAQAHSSDDDADDQNNRPVVDVELPEGKIGAKKKAKLEAKAEKRAQREVEEQQRAERKKKEQLAEEERKKNEERERLEEKQREEEERKAKEEKERREYEEYLKMKEAFSVEEEGFEENIDNNEMNLLQEFVKYIKDNKVVVIEDLAARFKLKTQAAIDRIKDLQNDNILTGVIDDRGKFIFVSENEMEAVAKFIRQRGRVSITELAENSNKLINFAPLGSVAQ